MKKNAKRQSMAGSERTNKMTNSLSRWVLIITGTLFVGIGTIGIFLPLLPTTPFLLLAAACYARSSHKFYNWLLNNKYFGDYIKKPGGERHSIKDKGFVHFFFMDNNRIFKRFRTSYPCRHGSLINNSYRDYYTSLVYSNYLEGKRYMFS
jgi:uncharacterized membrane protein YbaN (DUF454 family)